MKNKQHLLYLIWPLIGLYSNTLTMSNTKCFTKSTKAIYAVGSAEKMDQKTKTNLSLFNTQPAKEARQQKITSSSKSNTLIKQDTRLLQKNQTARIDNQHCSAKNNRLETTKTGQSSALLQRNFFHNVKTFQGLLKNLKAFPRLQKGLTNEYLKILETFANAAHPDATQEQIEACILLSHKLEKINANSFIQNLKHQAIERSAYNVAPGIIENQLTLAQQILCDENGTTTGIPKETLNALNNQIIELQEQLVKIAHDNDGNYIGLNTTYKKEQWAHCVAQFAEQCVFTDRAELNNFLKSCRNKNIEAFEFIAKAKIDRKSRSRAIAKGLLFKSNLKKNHISIDEVKAAHFYQDFCKLKRTLEAKNFEVARDILNIYKQSTSLQVRELYKELNVLYKQAGGPLISSTQNTQQTSSSSSTSTNIITTKQSTQMPQGVAADLQCYNSDAARYSMQEYMKQTDRMLTNMQDGPAQIAAQHIRDYVTTQCVGLTKEYQLFGQQFAQIISTIKDQHATLTDQALCNFLERVIENTINPQNWDINPIAEWQQGIADIAWRMQKGAELGQSLFSTLAKHQQNILPKLDNQQFTQLLKEGKTEQALNLLCQENKMFASIREKILHNLKNPISFFGRTARGIIDTGFTLEQAAADVALHNFRSKDEQQAVIDSWTKSYKTFVNNINNASADQVNNIVSSFIADGVTFGIAHKSYANIKANRPSNLIIKPAKNLNTPKIPQLKIGKSEITPEKTTIIKAPASFTGKGKTFNHHSKKAPTKNLRLMQQPFPKKLNETSLMQIRNQLPATTRVHQKPQATTPTKIAANSVAKKTSQTKSTKTSTSTDTQIQKDTQNKTTVAEQKGFKPAVEESAKRTGHINKSTINHEAHNAANYEKLKKDLTAQEKASTKSAQKTAKQRVSKEEKARLRDLRAKERKYLNDFNEKQKKICKEHSEYTHDRRHKLSDSQKPKEWHKLVPDDQKHEILAKPFDYTRHTHKHPALPKELNDNPRPIKINYEHITTPELEIQCKKGIVSGSGFHHDPGNKIEKSGFMQITKRENLPHNCYKFEWSAAGMREGKPSTLFPANWNRSKVIEKIYESMDSTQCIKCIVDSKQTVSGYVHLGLSSESIPIISVLKIEQNNAKVISAYPDFKKYNEFLQTGKI